MPARRSHRPRLLTLLAGVALALSLSACEQPHTNAALESAFDIRVAAESVDLFSTQVLTLVNHAAHGLTTQSIGQQHYRTVTALDIHGFPFVHITFTTPYAVPDLLAYAASLTPEHPSQTPRDEQPDAPYATTITGASTARAPISSLAYDLTLLSQIHSTLNAMQHDRIDLIAIDPTQFALSAPNGALWAVGEHQPLDPTIIERAHQLYGESLDTNNTPELLIDLSAAWDELLNPTPDPDATLDPASVDAIAQLRTPEGGLDAAAAARILAQQDARLAPDARNVSNSCRRILFITLCTTTERGSIPNHRNGHLASGFLQFPEHHGRAASGSSAYYSGTTCLVGGRTNQSVAGCGPAAFMSALYRVWADGEPFFGVRHSNQTGWRNTDYPLAHHSTTRNHLFYRMTAPTGARGDLDRPLITSYMGGCHFIDGTLTTPAGLLNGANRFLREQGKQDASRGSGNRLRLVGNTSYLLGNSVAANAKATILRREIGTHERPVIALFAAPGFLAYHYALVESYIIHSGSGYLVPNVQIRPLEARLSSPYNRYFSLSDPWLIATGLYHLQRY